MGIGIIVDIILFIMIAGNAVLGYKQGLTKLVIGICSSIIAIILVLILYKPITNYVLNNTNISQNMQYTIQDKLGALFSNPNAQNETQNTTEMQTVKLFLGDDIENLVQDTTNTAIQNISYNITQKIISVVVFFGLFAVIRLLLYILKSYMELIADLPIIRVFDGTGGMVYGVVKGFVIAYAVLAVISIVMPVIGNTTIINVIEQSNIGSKMFNNNVLMNFIFKFL